jgi:hypothetical protein
MRLASKQKRRSFRGGLTPVNTAIYQVTHSLLATTKSRRKSEPHVIVARFVDRTIGRPVMSAAGLSSQGTIAVGEVLTNPEYMKSLLQDAPQNWQEMNLEAVIESPITNGTSGPSRVEAVYFIWVGTFVPGP